MDTRDLVSLLRSGASALLRAPPGAGKTTTLLQLGNAALETTNDAVPLFIPLAEATRHEDLLEAAARRLAFASSGLDRAALATLATRCHLILLCDGWNEVDPAARARLSAELSDLRAQAPHLGLAVAGRSSDPALPIRDSFMLELGALTEEQQDEIASELGGPSSKALLNHARRTAGLADLIENPFYLTALVTTYASGELPSTKESIVRAFIAKAEAGKAASLWARLHGDHKEYLGAIAVCLQHARKVSLDENVVLATIFEAGETLLHRRLLRSAGEPKDILDALVDDHVLVRTQATGNCSIAFQHQLFQEWYASFSVDRAMQEATTGDPVASQRFVAELLNEPWWEEAVLFACERASSSEEKLPAIAATIRSALQLDSYFAAVVISRSGDSSWSLVRSEVVPLVESWMREGAVAKALEFIHASGRPDFAELVWPLVTVPERQRRLDALRSGRLTLKVLGPRLKERVRSLPEEVASDILAELCFSGMTGEFDVAIDIARSLSPKVTRDVADALAFRDAHSHLALLLRDAPSGVWERIAGTTHFDSILDSDVAERVRSARNALLASASAPVERLRLRVLGATHPDAPSVRADVAAAQFSESMDRSAYELLAAISKRFPDEVGEGVLDRVISGKPIPAGCATFLEHGISDDPALVRLAQDPSTPWHLAEAISTVLSEPLVSSLIDDHLSTLRGETSSTTRDRYHRLRTLLTAVPADRLLDVLVSRAPESSGDAVGALAELVARVGHDDEERRQPLSVTLKPKALPMVRAWADVMLGSDDTEGDDMVNVAMAIGRTGWTELTESLIALLDRDSARFRREREQQRVALTRGDRPILLPVSYGHQYSEAFVRLAGPASAEAMRAHLRHSEFGPDAARALRGMWERASGIVHGDPLSRRPFGNAAERRSSCLMRSSQTPHPDAEVIIDAALQISAGADKWSEDRALELLAVAARMPYGNRRQALLDTALKFCDHRNVIGLLNALACAGEVLSSAALVRRCRAEGNALRARRWDIEREWWRVDDFLRLLPFSDDPSAVLDVLVELADLPIRVPPLSNVIEGLRDSPDPSADEVLIELARRFPTATREYGWLTAVSERGSGALARGLADLGFEADEKPDTLSYDRGHFAHVLGTLLAKHRAVVEYAARRLYELATPGARSVVASALATVPDQDAVLAVLDYEARVAPPGSGQVPRSAIEGLVTERNADPSWSGAYSIVPKAAAGLRRALFTLSIGNGETARLAKRCLDEIEDLRRRYGRPDDEPRHPGGSGGPWSLISMTASGPPPHVDERS
jgi:hypothetical protein